MNESTAHSILPARTHTVTLLDTLNSATIHYVAIQDSATGPHNRSTTTTWNGSSQRELTVKELSGKRGAHQPCPPTQFVHVADCRKTPLRDAVRHRLPA